MIPLAIILVLAVLVYLAVRSPGIALLSSLIATIAAVIAFGSLDSAAGAAASFLLFFPTTCLAIILTRGLPDADSTAQTVAKWAFIIFGFSVAAMVGFSLGGPGSVFGIMFLILFFGMIISYLLKSRDAITVYIVSTIGACMRQNLPLAQALESAAAGRTDKRVRILEGIAMYLTQGNPLSTAIRLGYRKCPGYVTGLIIAAERIDQVPAAIMSLEKDMTKKAQDGALFKPVQPWYPVVLIFFALMLLSGMMVFILPKFQDIFERFGGSELPAITRALMGFQDYCWPLFPSLFLLFLVAVPVWIYVKFRPRRPENPRMFSTIGDFVKWHLPGLRWFERNYSLLHTAELLRFSLNAGATIDEAIANTLVLDVNGHFRERLARWQDKVLQGMDVSAAAAEVGLPDALVWAFDGKLNPGNTPTILETVEKTCRSNYNYRANLAKMILWPWTTIMVGAFVGFIAIGIFMPLVSIIRITAAGVLP